jgi:hypothetical protein
MPILRIEHGVPAYAGWKEAFDSDPLGRKRSGVRRYQVVRAMDDPNYVMIDLEFDGLEEAETFRSALERLWGGVQVRNPRARIIEVVENVVY